MERPRASVLSDGSCLLERSPAGSVAGRLRRAGRGAAPALVAALLVAGCHQGDRVAGELSVGAAISLKEAFESVAEDFERQHPRAVVSFDFGASGDLARRIEAGAPVDVFASADGRFVDRLAQAHLVDPDSRRALARNRLVLVARAGDLEGLRFSTLASDPRAPMVAVGYPDSVAAGAYAQEVLARTGEMPAMKDRLVHAANVRQVLDAVARGEADAGVVFATDVASAPGLRILDEIGPELAGDAGAATAIRYEVALVSGSKKTDLGRAFIEELAGPVGMKALAARGFLPP